MRKLGYIRVYLYKNPLSSRNNPGYYFATIITARITLEAVEKDDNKSPQTGC